MNQLIITLIGAVLLCALIVLPIFLSSYYGSTKRGPIALNNAGTHDPAAITRKAEAAIATEHLLVKQGTDADEIDVNGANDQPLGAAADPAAIGERIGVKLLSNGGTVLMVASEAISPGVEVYTAAAGKVSTLSAVAGTYYKVGMAVTSAGADGDEIEVMPTYPQAEVVV